MKHILDSFEIVKFCLRILIAEKQLLVLPLISGILISLFGIGVIGIVLFFPYDSMVSIEILKYVIIFFSYFFSSFIVTFCNAAFVAIVYEKLTGGNGSFYSGLKVAYTHMKYIFIWSVVSSTLGVLAKLSRDKLGFTGMVISTTYDLTWSLATYFVVPVILSGNNKSVKHSIQESTQLFHRTWKENIIGQFSTGILLLCFAVPPMVYLAYIAKAEKILLLVRLFPIALLYFGLLLALSYAINRIYMVVLYVYAKTGNVEADNYQELVSLAFKEGEQKR